MRSTIPSFAAAAACLLIAGCGSGSGKPKDARTAVVDATRAYQNTVLNHNAAGYCNALTGKAKAETIATVAPLGGATDCQTSAKRVFDLSGADDLQRVKTARDALQVSDVTLTGSTATVRLVSGKVLELVKVGDGWLISTVKPKSAP